MKSDEQFHPIGFESCWRDQKAEVEKRKSPNAISRWNIVAHWQAGTLLPVAIDKLIESNKYRERHLMVFISGQSHVLNASVFQAEKGRSVFPFNPHPPPGSHSYAILEVDWPVFIVHITMQNCRGISGKYWIRPQALKMGNSRNFLCNVKKILCRVKY